jgi:hypothetical protein
MPQKNKKLRVDIGGDKESIRSRIDRAGVMRTQSATSTFAQNHPPVKDACNAVVAAGKDLDDAEAACKAAEAELVRARSVRDAKVDAFDAAHAVCVAVTEQFATTPEDIQSIGLGVFDRASHVLAPPLAIEVRFDAAKESIRIYVKHAPGMTACAIEVSTDPIGPSTWKKLDGHGARRVLTGYAPGTYWFRAASVRANAQSAFTSPVSVIVK